MISKENDPLEEDKLNTLDQADTDSMKIIETLFQRVRMPDDISRSFATSGIHSGSDGEISHAPAPEDCDIPGFQFERVIGIGGFGTVYLAHDEKLERNVAVKMPRDDRWFSDDDRERFLEEARLAAKLQHPGIVTLHGLVEHSDRFCLVSEYVEGETLQDRMERETTSWRTACEIAAKIAEAMAHAHENRVIHRDLKPTNILMDDKGQPKVADFGLAIRGELSQTGKSIAAGTLDYMSPEQLPTSDQVIDHRSDIWSLGVVLYELVTGETPFRGDSRRELFDAIEHQDPARASTHNPNVPKVVDAIIQRCLAKSADDRYATADELANELRSIIAPSRITKTKVAITSIVVAAAACTVMFLFSPSFRQTMGLAPLPKLTATMQINHYRFSDDGLEGEAFGKIGRESHRIYEGDSVNISVAFSEPAYFRLIELTSSGEIAMHYASDPNSAPVKEAEFPIAAEGDLALVDGPGSCVFAVLCSREPIEDESLKELTAVNWSSGIHDGVWQFDNGRFRQLASNDRSVVTKRAVPPAPIRDACSQLTEKSQLSVCAIAFPIQPDPRSADSPANGKER